MTDKTKKIFVIYLAVAVLLTAALTALRSFALLSGYEPGIGYFAADARGLRIYRLLAAISVLLLPALAAPLHKKIDRRTTGKGIPVVFSFAMFSVLLLGFSVFRFFEMEPLSIATRLASGSVKLQAVICSFCTVGFGLISVLSLVFSISERQEENPLRAIGAMAFSLCALSFAVFLYFDFALPLNSDVKIGEQACFLVAAVFFLSDARISLGRPLWTGYVALGSVTFLLSFTVSVSDLLYSIVRDHALFDSAIGDFLLFGVAVFVFCHLLSLCEPTEAKIGEDVSALLRGPRVEKPQPALEFEQISFFEGEWKIPDLNPVRRGNDEAQDLDETDIFDSPDAEPANATPVSTGDVDTPLSILAMNDEAIPFPEQIAVEIPDAPFGETPADLPAPDDPIASLDPIATIAPIDPTEPTPSVPDDISSDDALPAASEEELFGAPEEESDDGGDGK